MILNSETTVKNYIHDNFDMSKLFCSILLSFELISSIIVASRSMNYDWLENLSEDAFEMVHVVHVQFVYTISVQ